MRKTKNPPFSRPSPRPVEYPAWTETWESSDIRWRVKWPKERWGTEDFRDGVPGLSTPLFVGKRGIRPEHCPRIHILSRNTEWEVQRLNTSSCHSRSQHPCLGHLTHAFLEDKSISCPEQLSLTASQPVRCGCDPFIGKLLFSDIKTRLPGWSLHTLQGPPHRDTSRHIP